MSWAKSLLLTLSLIGCGNEMAGPVRYFNRSTQYEVALILGQSNARGTGVTPPLIGDTSTIPYWERVITEWDATDFVPLRQLPDGEHGTELRMAQGLREQGLNPSVWKVVRSSTNANFWVPTGSSWLDFEAHFAAAQAKLPRHRRYWMIWIQGEADATNETTANAYAANLRLITARMRAVVGSTLRIFIVKLNNGFGLEFASTVRAAQVQVASESPYNTLVSLDHIGGASNITGPHYKSPALDQIGDTIAGLIAAEIRGTPAAVVDNQGTGGATTESMRSVLKDHYGG